MRKRYFVASLLFVLIEAGCGGKLPTANDPSGGTTPPATTAATRSDDFDRPNGPPGTNWAWQTGYGSPVIRDGRLGSTDSSAVIAWWASDSFAADQFSEGTVATGFDSRVYLQVFVRRQGSGVPYRYGFFYYQGNFDLKFDGGEPGVVIASVPGRQFRSGDVVRIEARGNRLRGLLNGVEVISTTHDALKGGQPGIVINPPDLTATYAWDAWRGGALP